MKAAHIESLPFVFDTVISGNTPLPAPRFRSLPELLFSRSTAEEDARSILLGTYRSQALSVSLGALAGLTVAIAAMLEQRGLRPGDTLCLVRLPRTSETVLGSVLVALSAWGARVLLPMCVDREHFGDWLKATNARAVLWAAEEVDGHDASDSDRELLAQLSLIASRAGVPTLCLHRDLGVGARLVAAPEAPPLSAAEQGVARTLIARSDASAESLILTTSATTGRAKLVRYEGRAFLAGCAAWEAAGLFAPDKLGGRCLCLLLCHSMGIRSLWNAVWTRTPLCLIPPEWFEEHPERVRSLLLEMRPEHVTGGPAVYRTLLELARVFPQLKEECFTSLRAAVSSGAPFDAELGRRLETVLGVRLDNAFGTTETQQVCSTLVDTMQVPFGDREAGRAVLGTPLPGVRLGLRQVQGREDDDQPILGCKGPVYRLSISSPFGCSGYLPVGPQACTAGDEHVASWFHTGDLVELGPEGLRYLGREEVDFVKDGFGVKIPRVRMHELYRDLDPGIAHLECFALTEEPGLAAVAFVGPDTTARRLRSALLARLERLRHELEEFELRHLTIARIGYVLGSPPRNAKGVVSRVAIARTYAPLIAKLTGPYVKAADVVTLDGQSRSKSATARLSAPRRGELLRAARLDKHFTAAHGDMLTYREDGRDHSVIDFVGGFGANLLGHRHPRVLHAAQSFLAGLEPPIGDQGSANRRQGELAQRLALTVGKYTGDTYVVRFGSTGAEVVEMALTHALLERNERVRKLLRAQTQSVGALFPKELREVVEETARRMAGNRPKLLAVAGAFHGNTSGARAALGSAKRRLPFAALTRLESIFVPADGDVDIDALVAREEMELPHVQVRDGRISHGTIKVPGIIAAIAEPILGEGGVQEVEPGLLDALSRHSFPLILDEIQCGLGRSGHWLASEGVRGHYYLFAKSLGGGIAKTAALLVERSRYVAKFDENYGSTFAGDPFSCTVGCAVLDVLDSENVAARARERGARLAAALGAVREAFPDVVRAVRGRGLMWGLELDPSCGRDSILLRAMAKHEHLGVLAASYLLHEHGVRLLPTLSAPTVLRVAPSAFISDDAIARLGIALADLCALLRGKRARELVAPIVRESGGSPEPLRAAASRESLPPIPTRMAKPAEDAVRIGFVNHFVHPERELALLEPTLADLSPAERRVLFRKQMELFEMRPVIAFARNLFGGRIWFCSIPCAVDAATLEDLHRRGERDVITERFQEAVDAAAAEGCSAVALGAYSSILTLNGTSILPPPGVRITSGNTLTVAAGAQRIRRACVSAGIDPSDPRVRVGIVGAGGNIGAALAHRLLAGPGAFSHATLISRTAQTLEPVRASLLRARPGIDIKATSDLAALGECDVIAVAVSTNAPIVYPRHLGARRPMLIGDVSVPGAVSNAVRAIPGVHLIPLTGVLAMPGEPDFVMSSHSRRGTAFCCAVEAMLLGLEPSATAGLRLVGEVDPAAVDVLDRLALARGFLKDGLLGPQRVRRAA